MPNIGLPELLIIALVLVLLFGARKIPELMKGLGSGIKEFKKAANGDEDKPTPPPSTPSSTTP